MHLAPLTAPSSTQSSRCGHSLFRPLDHTKPLKSALHALLLKSISLVRPADGPLMAPLAPNIIDPEQPTTR